MRSIGGHTYLELTARDNPRARFRATFTLLPTACNADQLQWTWSMAMTVCTRLAILTSKLVNLGIS